MSAPTTKPNDATPPDPEPWLDRHGDYLYGYAMVRVRDAAVAEDLVQETLLAALQGYERFGGRSSERTWLVGILKHKVIDHFRRTSRESTVSAVDEEAFEHREMFRDEGGWVGHWKASEAPIEWTNTPATELERAEFWSVLETCLTPLPQRIASAFTLREVDGMSTDEICDVLGVTTNNLWVMLHRARAHLRACIERKWFRRAREGK
jgi:RNA polymerase sigma-70 factor (ECF subfamily)